MPYIYIHMNIVNQYTVYDNIVRLWTMVSNYIYIEQHVQ